MAGTAYPHIVFAKDADTLPRAELESLLLERLGDVDPTPTVDHGPLQVVLRLGEYAFTFWYDDDAEGLGDRYADYAPTIRRRRISRSTTMIDLSGRDDPDGTFADVARRITELLAERDGVYVFSEEAKAFVGMDEADPFADRPAAPAEPAPTDLVEPEPAAPTPQPEPTSPAEPEPTSVAEPEPAAPAEPVAAAPAEPEPTPPAEPAATEPEPVPEPERDEAPETDETSTGGEREPVHSGVDEHPTAEPEPDVRPEPAATEPADREEQPAKEEGGFFRRLFGRRR